MSTDAHLDSKLKFRSSTYQRSASYASRGDSLFWGGRFPEDKEAWASFRIFRTGRLWALSVWTHDATAPSLTRQFDTKRDAKATAQILADAVAVRYDGRTIPNCDFYMVDSYLREVAVAADLWVKYPTLRDQTDVERFAKLGLTVSL